MNIVYKHDDLSYVWKSWMIKDAGTRSNNKSMNGIARPSISSIHTHRLMIIESLCAVHQKMAVPSLLTFIEVKLSSLTFSVVSNFGEKIEPRPAGICAWFWRSRNSITQETLVHAPKLWAEKISKRALIIVSINKRWLFTPYKICTCMSMSSEEILCLKPRENI